MNKFISIFSIFTLALVLLTGCGRSLISAENANRFRRNWGKASYTVYPVNVLKGKAATPSFEAAELLADRLNLAGAGKTVVANKPLPIPLHRTGKANLFDQSAHAMCKAVFSDPPMTEYAVYGEFLFPEKEGKVKVNYYICDKQGRLVAGKQINSHSKVYKRVKPVDVAGCVEVVVGSLKEIHK